MHDGAGIINPLKELLLDVSPDDCEPWKLAGCLLPGDVTGGYFNWVPDDIDTMNQRLKEIFPTFGNDLNLPGIKVPYISGNTCPEYLFPYMLPEPDLLNIAINDDMDTLHYIYYGRGR
jgi:hypothetical protein